ncbi:hypothetical protein [Endozoicomonas sp. 8E]|uniref:hypothetical protein n=1 Tax=Endozoicomonas sp. 8E TaxID=3035692 RepID=UPI002939546C|nr:hypothetical protein [Endozoicomonas sp. 8E]WOG30157.1 hypothetical protein P6910_11040 [Endozoicomonas sp. 8E]
MDPGTGLDGSCVFASLDHASKNQIKEQGKNQGHTVASVMPLVSSGSYWMSACQQTPISLRKYSAYDYPGKQVFKHIQDVFLEKSGIPVVVNKGRLAFDFTEKINEDQDGFFKGAGYHAILGHLFDGTDIPDLIRAERLIPVVQEGDSKKQMILEFKHFPTAYVHTLYGEETPLKTLPIAPFYNSQALNDVNTSMLRVDTFDVGFSDGSPRYIFTTGLQPCICVAFFDKSQNKVVLCHFGGTNFSPKNLSEIFDFCDEQKMKSLECHIVGGKYNYLGQKNGFLTLIDYISSKGVPINQMFVGDTKERPKSIVIDTRDMSLYKLPFCELDFPVSCYEMDLTKENFRHMATMPLITKNHSLSLLTAGLDS